MLVEKSEWKKSVNGLFRIQLINKLSEVYDHYLITLFNT